MTKSLTLLSLLLWLTAGTLAAQGKKAYVLFDKDGKETTYENMLKTLGAQDAVFIGEIHNCPIAHWMELEIIKDLYALHKDKLMLGAEMFETDDQLILNEYLNNVISNERFKKEAKLWPNYDTDYAKIVEFAKENHITFIATNIPRRYAGIVSRGGLEALDKLTDEAKHYIAPLPLNYVRNENVENYFNSMKMPGMKQSNTDNLAKAQAIKDATMGWSIAQNLKSKFVHFNGSFHSDSKQGIITYLNQYRPGLKIGTVAVIRQANPSEFDKANEGHADFYICVPQDMTTTY